MKYRAEKGTSLARVAAHPLYRPAIPLARNIPRAMFRAEGALSPGLTIGVAHRIVVYNV